MALHNTQQVADVLQMAARNVTKLIREGKLKATKVGRRYMIESKDVDRYTGIKKMFSKVK